MENHQGYCYRQALEAASMQGHITVTIGLDISDTWESLQLWLSGQT